jgi:hypothetical protein
VEKTAQIDDFFCFSLPFLEFPPNAQLKDENPLHFCFTRNEARTVEFKRI